MPSLLISLGTSWLIVPEAFHRLPPGPSGFRAVHVLTTDNPKIDEGLRHIETYFADYPEVALSFTRVQDFVDLTGEADHFQFEEVLYRWYLDRAAGTPPYVCIAGGFKTMSAAMQKAASLFGAVEVFHVLADIQKVSDPANLAIALQAQEIHYINLGSESGWPQLRGESASHYPLICHSQAGLVRRVSAPDQRLREHIKDIVERSHRVAESWSRLADLPFATLATWSAADLDWLEQPLDAPTDAAWLRALPKVELHCHLGGFASQGETLRQVRAAARFPDQLPAHPIPDEPPGWPQPPVPLPLPDYMKLGDATGRELLKDPGCLEQQCRLLYEHLIAQTIIYAEVRCSPNNYATPPNNDGKQERSAWDVLSDIRSSFEACMANPTQRCHINLLIIATRRDGGDRSDISRHLAHAITAAQHWQSGCRVDGVDLAGFENRDTRAALFATDFEPVHRVGLAVTVHAGENDDAEGIWQAVFKLNARRLGHALRLLQAPDLCRAVADRRIGVEMCPFANYQIQGFHPMLPASPEDPLRPAYPLLDYLNKGVPVTVNTDNIGISAASLNDNLLFLSSLVPGITRRHILQLQANALEVAFVDPDSRRHLRAHFAHLLPGPLAASLLPP